MQKKRRAAIATAIGGIAFGLLLVIVGTVSLISDPGATVSGGSNGIPTWISGPILILAGVGIAVPFVMELRRLLRESRG